MGEIIQFPDAAERALWRSGAKAAANFLRDFLADGPQTAVRCRIVLRKFSDSRAVYERAREGLWVIGGGGAVLLALPEHAQDYVGLDARGAPIAWPVKPRKYPRYRTRQKAKCG
jgi:hypothetical protein